VISPTLFFIIYFLFFFVFPYFSCWSNLSYIFGCDCISYGLILLRFWISVLIITNRESVLRVAYFPGLFLVFVVLLVIILFCTFSSFNLFSFYLFLRVTLFLLFLLF
jgi:hypothetical protein